MFLTDHLRTPPTLLYGLESQSQKGIWVSACPSTFRLAAGRGFVGLRVLGIRNGGRGLEEEVSRCCATPNGPGGLGDLPPIDINQAIDQGSLSARPLLCSNFPLAEGETLLAQGGFALLDFVAPGDGTYVHNNGFFFMTGGLGAIATLSYAAGRAIGNANRRAAAAAAATPRWMQIDSGVLHVTSQRMCFQTPQQFYTWGFTAVTTAQLVAPFQLNFTGTTDRDRSISWILQSEWAPLCFTLWARTCHPQHPQFVTRRWIPPGWHDRVQAFRRGIPEARE